VLIDVVFRVVMYKYVHRFNAVADAGTDIAERETDGDEGAKKKGGG